MSDVRIIKVGKAEVVAGLTWEFGTGRPEGITRTDPHVTFGQMITGTKLAEAEGLPPLALLIATAFEGRGERRDASGYLWATSATDSEGSLLFVMGQIQDGEPSPDPELFFDQEHEFIEALGRAVQDSGLDGIAISRDIDHLISDGIPKEAFDAESLHGLEVAPLTAGSSHAAALWRLGPLAVAGVAAVYGFYAWYAGETVEIIPQEKISLMVDRDAYLAACEENWEVGFPVPLGWSEDEAGCSYFGGTDPVVQKIALKSGGIAYSILKLEPGRDRTIASNVAEYVYDGRPETFVFSDGRVIVARHFDVPLVPFKNPEPGAVSSSVKDRFLGTADRFNEGIQSGRSSVRFTAELTQSDVIERLKNLPNSSVTLLKRKGQRVEVVVTTPEPLGLTKFRRCK
jgi:hypothetical protein